MKISGRRGPWKTEILSNRHVRQCIMLEINRRNKCSLSQRLPDKSCNNFEHLTFVLKLHFCFRRMDIDINGIGSNIEEEEK